MTHTHESIYPIHIGTKVFLKYNLSLTFHFQYTALPWVEKDQEDAFNQFCKKI